MATLEEVLHDLDARVQNIEKRLAIRPSAPSNTPAATPQAAQTTTERTALPTSVSSYSFLGVIGITFVLLAAVFFVKLSIDSGWLTPARQVSLAALFGLACLLSPHFIEKLATDYGALLSGAGVVILHLTWFGGFQVHQLYSAQVALLLASLVGILSISVNYSLGNRVFVLVAIAGTYLAVPLIGFKHMDRETIASFLLIWNLSFSALGYFLNRRDMLFVAAYFAIFLVGIMSLADGHLTKEMALEYLWLQLTQFAIFSLSTLSYSIFHRKEVSQEESWLFFPVLMLLYGHFRFLLESISPEIGPYIGLGFALLVLAIYSLAKIQLRKELPSAAAIYSFVCLASFHSVYLELTPDTYKPLLSLGIACLFIFGIFQKIGDAWRVPSLVLAAAFGYGAILTLSDDLSFPINFVYNLSFGIAALATVAFWFKSEKNPAKLGYTVILGFAHLQVLQAIYRLSLKVESGALFVSSCWGAYALAILLWAVKKKDRSLGNSAILILIAVGLKASFYDLWHTGSLIRVLSLLISGLLLYGCGWIYQRMQGWPKSNP